MKSSSSLFPVALMRAEVLSSAYIEDTYLLKPNNSPDLTVQVALTRLGFNNDQSGHRGTPIVLIHGLHENRSCWLGNDFDGLGFRLLEAGLDPWMLEFRGHGDSPVNAHHDKNTIELYAQFDLPAVQQFINEQTSKSAIWIGHGIGGVAIASSIGEGRLQASLINGIALFNSQVSSFPILYYLPVIKSIKYIRQFFRKVNTNSKQGPEAEPRGVLLEQLRWSGLLTRWKSRKGLSYWSALDDVTIPVISFSGALDRANPVRACEKLAFALDQNAQSIVLSKSNGFAENYGYQNTIRGTSASNEVWPIVLEWTKTLTSK